MPGGRNYVFAVILTWGVTLLPSTYYAYRQVLEDKIVDGYLYANGLVGSSITRETAIRVSDQIRKDFNINESSFVALKMSGRPFLREDTGFLLTHREGVCGEGTRVIINLLSRLGFDATRVTLYDRHLFNAHTLVSVLVDGHEFFVDSINSSSESNALLKTYDLAPNHFRLMSYRGDIAQRVDLKTSVSKQVMPKALAPFFARYWLYSYEAIPYAKLLDVVGLEVRAFNLKRPPRLLSIMAEKPNMVMFLAAFIASVMATYALHRFRIIRKLMSRIAAQQELLRAG